MTAASDPEDSIAKPASGLPEPALAAQAVSEVLRPLARLMIDHGLQHSSMVELLKKALVDEAVASYGPSEKASTDTRIALLTGLHRKDVRRLREAPAERGMAAPMVPVAAAVVGRWISDPRFLSADKSPMPLARTPKLANPGVPDFPTLVAEVSRDVGARAVLDELQRLGVVTVNDDGQVLLKDTAFVPQEGLSESCHFLATNVSDQLSTAVHNMSPNRTLPVMLEQSAFAADLSHAQVDALHQLARRLWAGVLQQFLQSATVAEQRSEGADGPRQRVRFGVYFHQAEQTPSLPPQEGKPARRHKRKS
jgi:hypothetical protein